MGPLRHCPSLGVGVSWVSMPFTLSGLALPASSPFSWLAFPSCFPQAGPLAGLAPFLLQVKLRSSPEVLRTHLLGSGGIS